MADPLIFDGRPSQITDAVQHAYDQGDLLESDYRRGIVSEAELDEHFERTVSEIYAALKLPPRGHLILTSSFAEAVNSAIKGFAWGSSGKEIITIAGDPPGFNEAALWCEAFGFVSHSVPLSERSDLPSLDLSETIALLALSSVTPEVFTQRNLYSVKDKCAHYNIPLIIDFSLEYFLTGTINCEGCSAVIIDASVLGDPCNSCLLWIKSGSRWSGLLSGGFYQDGRRNGRFPLNATFALKQAVVEALSVNRYEHFTALIKVCSVELTKRLPQAIFPSVNNPLPLGLTFIIPDLEGEAIVEMMSLRNIHLSTGSSCGRKAGKPSAVLTAMGYTPSQISGMLSIVFSDDHTSQDVVNMLDQLCNVIKRLRLNAGIE